MLFYLHLEQHGMFAHPSHPHHCHHHTTIARCHLGSNLCSKTPSCNRCQLHDGLPHQCGWLFTPHEAKVLFGLRFALRILRRHEDSVRMEKSLPREEPILGAIGDTLSRIIKSFPSARERAGHPRKRPGILSWATMRLLAG